jgi:hypothetical protein
MNRFLVVLAFATAHQKTLQVRIITGRSSFPSESLLLKHL